MKMRERALMAAAEKLAARLAHHAECGEHPANSPDSGCPYCLDRAAYAAWIGAGGRDYRPDYGGPSITLDQLMAQEP